MKVREKTLQNYLKQLVKSDRIKGFLKENAPDKKPSNFSPSLSVVEQVSRDNPSQFAGLAIRYRSIQISQWICVDKDEAFSTVRHELAHCIKSWCDLSGSHHGRGFTEALKLVSPRLWRKDRHWTRTPEIEKARRGINHRVWSPAKARKYYIQIFNGAKFAWRQMTFDGIVKLFKKDPKQIWTNGNHCTRIDLTFVCKAQHPLVVLHPAFPGTAEAAWRTMNQKVDSYLKCPTCDKPTEGNVILSGLGGKSWTGTPKAWSLL